MPFTIIAANSADSHEIATLLHRSILELCTADHGNDPEKYEPWLKNKTAANIESWINGQGGVFTAIDPHRKVLGVAMGSPDGEVLLNYVLPDVRCMGVSKMLMRTLEDYFRDRGLDTARLKSTETASRFYHLIGFTETGEIETRRGMTFREFEKVL
ncbi:GNAT family N-acetyltransferase [Roseibium marinum]|uniref:Acetyltransferase (GNAT) family protein n=1 Tax=Roseibium marinum TaxID=281252 RepID=A0A2S3UNU0_9HYPH|nr:GNAT family N-acetyltransferase [Roseibium marinum]POF29344.1 acetyltransferase (GNAT) family protein [Roseibium marinum]